MEMDISRDVSESEHNINVDNPDSQPVVEVGEREQNLEENCTESTDVEQVKTSDHNINVDNPDSQPVVEVGERKQNLKENCTESMDVEQVKTSDLVANPVTNSAKTLKRKDLSIKEKQDLLERYDALPKCSQREAASKLGISQSALCNLLKQRDRIDKEMLSIGNGSRKRKRNGKCKSVETALWEWFKSARLRNTPISREVLMEKATEFAIMLEEEFSATDGWLTRWKERYNIKHRMQHPEKDETQNLKEESTKPTLSKMLRDYEPRQIFCAGETALFYRALPEHAYMWRNGETHSKEYDKATKRITVLLACCQDGSVKKTPLVVGGNKDPASLRGIKNLPLDYFCNKYALMTSDIFSDYLTKWDEELKGEKIVLLLDECAAHPNDIPLKNIKLVFLTSEMDYVLHPLRQGVVKSFKCHYRKAVVKKVIDAIVKIDASREITRSVSLLDSMHMINEAWAAVGAKTVKHSFEKCGLSLGESPDVAGALERENYDESFLEYVAIDENLQTTCENNEEDIVDMIRERGGCDVEYESGSDSEVDVQRAPTAAETREALHIIRRTLELKGANSEAYREFYALENNIEKLLTKDSEKSWVDNFFVKLH